MKNINNGFVGWMRRLLLVTSLLVFMSAGASWAYSISGTVGYIGSKTGRIYLSLYSQSGAHTGLGTSISGPGAYTIRLSQAMSGGGTFFVKAVMDTIGSGVPNTIDPLGQSIPITLNGVDQTNIGITLTDSFPALPPAPPQNVTVTPGDSSALVMWEGPRDSNDYEAAQTYNIYWSTNSAVMTTFSGSVTGIPARSDGHRIVTGLANGDALYFAVTSQIGTGPTSESTALVTPTPSTIGTPAGGTTVSGTVTFSGTPPAGPLFIGIGPPNSNPIAYTIYSAPTDPQTFTVSGIPPGTYSVFAFIDANGSGSINPGDPRTTRSNTPLILVSGSPLAGVAVPLNGANAAVSTATGHYIFNGNPNWYGLQFRAENNLKLPVKVTLNSSGAIVPGPVDLGINQWGEFQYDLAIILRPTVGDTYTFTVSYPDSGLDLISSSVTGVLDSFATPLTPVGNIYGPIAATPAFTWQEPTSPPPPAVYTYGLQFWPYWQVDSMPMTQFSATYNFDGNASAPLIPLASTYNWMISLTDAKGNQSINVAAFTTPPNLDAQPGTASGTFSYPPGTSGTLTLNWTSASFICDGPAVGTETQSVTGITATTMTWVNGADTMIWTRSPAGTAGNILGIWNTTDPRSGNTFTITFNSDNTHTVTGTISQCQVTGGPVDTQPPTVPTGVTTLSAIATSIAVNWNASTDNVGVNYYLVYRNGSAVGAAFNNSWVDTTVSAGTTYNYTVAACDSSGNCSAQSFPPAQAKPLVIMNYGGVFHLTNGDTTGNPVDVLQMGFGMTGSSLGVVSATVSGPAGFTYTFSDADIRPYLNGQFEVYKEFSTPLAAGVYTFTLNDGNGNISNRVDTHANPLSLPIANSTKIQYLRKADGSHRFTWAPVNDTKTYYYRLRINKADGTHTPVYGSTRKMDTIEDVPAGTLLDGIPYEVRVFVADAPDYSLVFNQSNSAYMNFTPQASDYNPSRLMFSYASANNVLGGNPAFGFRMATTAGTSTKNEAQLVTTPATLIGPSGFSDTISTANLVSPNGVDFLKSMAAIPGNYTLDVLANGIHHIAYLTLTSPVLYPVPDATKFQAEDMGSSVRFSWPDVDYTGALYYRIFVQDSATTKVENYFSSSRLNQTSVDIAKINLGTLANRQWRAEIYDSLLADTQRNRVNGNYVSLAGLQAYDATKPTVNQFRFLSLNRPNGLATEIAVTAADSDGILSAVNVTTIPPSSYSRNLLTQGQQLILNTYSLIEDGAPAAGLYSLTVTDNTAKTVTRYNQQPTPHDVPLVDFHTFQAGLEVQNFLRFSWAPVVTDVPLWYTLEVVDINTFAVIYTIQNVQVASVVVNTSTLQPALSQGTVMFRIRANDGSNGNTTNNSSQSVFVGYQPGLNYATLTDNDNDGYASNIDTNDNNPAINPSVPGSIVFSPSSVNFGNLGIGSSSAQAVTVTNTGGGSIIINSSNQTGDTDLSISSGGLNPCPTLPVIMPAGYGCTLIASFNPLTTGAKTFTMSLVSNAANNPVSITISGNALPASITTVNLANGSSNPSYLADPVTFTGSVTPPTATGTIQFRIDGLDYGVPVPLIGGVAASVPVANLTLGPHSISAIYSGDSSLGGSTATGFTQTVIDKVMIGSNGNFPTLDAAVKAALNNETLLLRDTRFAEDLLVTATASRPSLYTITLKGGLSSDFSTPSGTPTSLKSLKIRQGKVIASRLVLKLN